jgi:hypothetical protein
MGTSRTAKLIVYVIPKWYTFYPASMIDNLTR